jgi:hypothetical protein
VHLKILWLVDVLTLETFNWGWLLYLLGSESWDCTQQLRLPCMPLWLLGPWIRYCKIIYLKGKR